METFEAIEKQMNEASDLLERLANLVPLPKGVSVSGGQAMAKVRYDKATVNQLEKDISNWQYVTKTVVDTCFGFGKRHSIAFEKTIVVHRIYMDAREDLTNEVSEGFNVLKSVIEAEDIKAKLNISKPNKKLMSKPNKIFISHNQQDGSYSTALVNMLLKLGVKQDDIFCSSYPGFGVPMGEDFLNKIYEQFSNHTLTVFFIHSPRFYTSHVSLCEMGAAWLQGCKVYSFLTKDCEFSDLTGVIRSSCTAFRAGQENTYPYLNDLYDYLVPAFGLTRNTSLWESAKADFINIVEAITFDPVPKESKSKKTEVNANKNTREKILDYIANNKHATAREVAKHFGLPFESVKRVLNSLCDEGVIVATSNGSRYIKFLLNKNI